MVKIELDEGGTIHWSDLASLEIVGVCLRSNIRFRWSNWLELYVEGTVAIVMGSTPSKN